MEEEEVRLSVVRLVPRIVKTPAVAAILPRAVCFQFRRVATALFPLTPPHRKVLHKVEMPGVEIPEKVTVLLLVSRGVAACVWAAAMHRLLPALERWQVAEMAAA